MENRRPGRLRSFIQRYASDDRSRSPRRRDDTSLKREPSLRRRYSRERSPLKHPNSVSKLYNSPPRRDRSPTRRYRAEVTASDITQRGLESAMEEM